MVDIGQGGLGEETEGLTVLVTTGSISGTAWVGSFLWMGACTGVGSASTTEGDPKLASRPRILDGVGTSRVLMRSFQVTWKMFLMPFGTAMLSFLQCVRSLEM